MAFEWVKEIVPAVEMTEGPYYGRGGPHRSDIREGLPGRTFDLLIKVVDAADGKPLKGLKVDLWHCDARGRYSGYEFDPDKQPENVQYQMPNRPGSWLRGHQVTDEDGLVRFTTIFPGWYATRTPHIHLKVFDGPRCILTSQLYLPEAQTQAIYEQDQHYRRRVSQDTFNQTDIVLAKADGPIDGCWVELIPGETSIRGESLLAVDPQAQSVRKEIPEGFRPPIGGIPHDKPVR
jgi:protocatechuate 3,4-dioxygenase beta subunit